MIWRLSCPHQIEMKCKENLGPALSAEAKLIIYWLRVGEILNNIPNENNGFKAIG